MQTSKLDRAGVFRFALNPADGGGSVSLAVASGDSVELGYESAGAYTKIGTYTADTSQTFPDSADFVVVRKMPGGTGISSVTVNDGAGSTGAPGGSTTPAAVVSAATQMSPEEKAASRAALDVRAQTVPFTRSATGAVAKNIGEWISAVFISVKDFGALGDGVADDTAAIQKALDLAAYTVGVTAKVYFPTDGGGIYKTTDTLHACYGYNSFNSLVLEGESSYSGHGTTVEACIRPTFNDRPAINIQGGRRVTIRTLSLRGVNHDWLWNNWQSIQNRAVVANWYGQNISAANNSRYAPYAGISVDAYSGAAQAQSYPAVSYPPFLGSNVPQYGKNYSSEILLEDVSISGFVVGLIIQPNAVPDASQGDFVTVRGGAIELNIVNVACGNADNRIPYFIGTKLWMAHTVFDSLTYGNQHGSMAVVAQGCCFDQVFQILNINVGGHAVQGGFNVSLSGCYGEGINRFGVGRTGIGARPGGVEISQCKFALNLKSGEYSAAHVYDAPGSELFLRNVVIHGTHAFVNINANVTMDNLVFQSAAADPFNAGGSPIGGRASSYLCGVWAPTVRLAVVKPVSYATNFGATIPDFQIDSRCMNISAEIAAGIEFWAWRGLPIPHFVEMLAYGKSRFSVSGVPPLTLDRATYNLSGLSKSGSEHTFTVNTGFITSGHGDNTEADYSVGTGDFVIEPASGICFFVLAVSFSGSGVGKTMTITLRQINMVRPAGGTAFTTPTELSVGSGTLVFHNSRRCYPGPYRLAMTATAASGDIAMKVCGDEANINSMTYPARVGDYLISNAKSETPADSVFPKFSKITASNPNTGAITVDKTARRSYYGDAVLVVRNTAIA
jgi:hypothetical protein